MIGGGNFFNRGANAGTVDAYDTANIEKLILQSTTALGNQAAANSRTSDAIVLDGFTKMQGDALAQERAKVAALENRVGMMELGTSVNAQFAEINRRMDHLVKQPPFIPCGGIPTTTPPFFPPVV